MCQDPKAAAGEGAYCPNGEQEIFTRAWRSDGLQRDTGQAAPGPIAETTGSDRRPKSERLLRGSRK
jgi:hypothetical protein